jgi:hypothetical protein
MSSRGIGRQQEEPTHKRAERRQFGCTWLVRDCLEGKSMNPTPSSPGLRMRLLVRRGRPELVRFSKGLSGFRGVAAPL